MQIDWFTVLAQIANFLVLIWLLQRFLYRPISQAMARREQRIEERLAEARESREQAEAEAKRLREREQALEDRKEEEIAAARREADALREKLEAEIRDEVSEKRRAWLDHLEEERGEVVRLLQRRLYRLATEAARRMLAGFAGTGLSERIAETFTERLGTLGEEERRRLARAAEEAEGRVTVESGEDFPTAVRDRLTGAVHEHIGEGIEVAFSPGVEDLLGIRLRAGEQTVEWSPDRYLERLDGMLDEALEARMGELARE